MRCQKMCSATLEGRKHSCNFKIKLHVYPMFLPLHWACLCSTGGTGWTAVESKRDPGLLCTWILPISCPPYSSSSTSASLQFTAGASDLDSSEVATVLVGGWVSAEDIMQLLVKVVGLQLGTRSVVGLLVCMLWLLGSHVALLLLVVALLPHP